MTGISPRLDCTLRRHILVTYRNGNMKDNMSQTGILSYVMEKTQQAIRTLATGPGTLPGRLLDAAICYATVIPGKMPEGPARDTYTEFFTRMTAVKASSDEGDFQATISSMSEIELIEMVDLIFKLEDALQDALPR